nr:aquaporin-5 [Quercus suber]
MVLIGAISIVRGILLFIAQMLGAIVAAYVVQALFTGELNVSTTLATTTTIAQGVIIEMLLTAQLVFTIFMLAAEKHTGNFIAPVGIGLSLFIAELTGVFWTGGSLNPARSFAPAVAIARFHKTQWVYWVGPLAGSVLATLLYKLIKALEYETANADPEAMPPNGPGPKVVTAQNGLAAQCSQFQCTAEHVFARTTQGLSSAGFIGPSVQASRGGQASCVTGIVPVSVTSNNTLFNYQVPLNQTQVTETFLDLITAGSSFAQKIVSGHHQVTDTYNISATICTPRRNPKPDRVQIATHGVGLDKSYWDFAADHSYADAAAANGYATFFYDRLSVGASSKPADGINVVQVKLEFAILHSLIGKLRAGQFSNIKPVKVVGVGHSYGSFLTQGINAVFPDDLGECPRPTPQCAGSADVLICTDAAILTGFSLDSSAVPAFYTALNPKIASQQNSSRFGTLDNTYLVSSSDISDHFGFLRAPGFDSRIIPVFEATKGSFTFGELFTLTDVTAPATKYTKPVAVVDGANDFSFCFGNCSYPSNLAQAVFPALYPAVPASRTGTYLAPIAGHGLNLHYSADAAFDYIQNFIHTQVEAWKAYHCWQARCQSIAALKPRLEALQHGLGHDIFAGSTMLCLMLGRSLAVEMHTYKMKRIRPRKTSRNSGESLGSWTDLVLAFDIYANFVLGSSLNTGHERCIAIHPARVDAHRIRLQTVSRSWFEPSLRLASYSLFKRDGILNAAATTLGTDGGIVLVPRHRIRSDCKMSISDTAQGLAALCKADQPTTDVEAYQQWPYVLHIILRLSASVLFRDALLRLQPRFLGDIIEQVVTSDIMSPSYTSLAAAMLSHPLPRDCMLPAHGQTFFLRLIERCTVRPVISTVRPILDVLHGTSTLLLGLLSAASLSRFEEQLFSILRSSIARSQGDQGEGCLTLYCLAIMKVVIEASNDRIRLTASSFDGQDLLASTPGQAQNWNVYAMRKFFTKTKTLHLLVLRVMDAVRTHPNRSLDDQLTVLRLSNDLLGAIPSDLKSSWCVDNVSLIQRLELKARSAELDKDLQLQVYAFLFGISPPNHIQNVITEIGRQSVVRGKTSFLISEYAGTDAVIGFIAGCMTPGIMPIFLRIVLDVLSQSKAGDMIQLSSRYVRLLGKISLSVRHDQKLAEAVAMSTSSPSFTSQLWSFANGEDSELATTSLMDSEAPICTVVLRTARCLVVHALGELLISSAIVTNNLGQDVPGQTITLLLKLHVAHIVPPQVCCHDPYIPPNTVGCDSVVSRDQQSDQEAHDWRVALSAHFSLKGRAEYEQVVRIFSQACAALESRCDAAEEPFRSERDAREALQGEYDLLSKAFSKLESHMMSTELRLEVLEQEKLRNLRELECSRKLADDLNARLLESQDVLKSTVSKAACDKAESYSFLERAKLEHATVLARMQEELEESQNRNDITAQALKLKSEEMLVLQAELHRCQTAYKQSGQDAERLQKALEARDQQIVNLEASAKNETGRCLEFEDKYISIQAEMLQREDTYNQHLQQAREHADQGREEIRASGSAALEQLAARHSEEVARIEMQLHDVGEELDSAKAHHSITMARRNDELLDLQQQVRRFLRNAPQILADMIQVERLQDRCEQKDKQIGQANAMRINLMAAMGITRTEADEIALREGLPDGSRPSSPRGSIQQACPVMQDLSPLSPCSRLFDGEQHDHESASFTLSHFPQELSGPMPKQPPPRKSMKQVTKVRSHVRQDQQIAQTRQPLLNLSVNKTPRKTRTKSWDVHSPIRGELSSEESTFAGSEIFAGTAVQNEVDEMLQRLR